MSPQGCRDRPLIPCHFAKKGQIYFPETVSRFSTALNVKKAVGAFNGAHERYPDSLNELVPEFLDAHPTFGQAFELTWELRWST